MNTVKFKSYFVSKELNLNGIASHFGMNKKIKWGEPLRLDEEKLRGVIKNPEGRCALLFHFGSIVCCDMAENEVNDLLKYLSRIDSNIKGIADLSHTETFSLIEQSDGGLDLQYNQITLSQRQDYHDVIISTVLAKSVALEIIENDIDVLLDEMEKVIKYLEKGNFKLKDKILAKMSSKILSHKYNSISYIMMLDKPDIVWNNERAEELYTDMSNLFEMQERYNNIKHKVEVLLDITEVFTSLSHAKRGTRLEIMVIALIFMELVISVLKTFFGG